MIVEPGADPRGGAEETPAGGSAARRHRWHGWRGWRRWVAILTVVVLLVALGAAYVV